MNSIAKAGARSGRGWFESAILAAAAVSVAALTGCGAGEPANVGYPYKTGAGNAGDNVIFARDIDDADSKRTTVFGKGNPLFGNNKAAPEGGSGGIGVNSYLWRASLETISFMPVSSADPFGGVVLTDWYTPGETPNERFKLNIYILGKALRADGVKVAVFRQVKDASGGWADANTPDQTALKIEDAILTKARQLRNNLAQQ